MNRSNLRTLLSLFIVVGIVAIYAVLIDKPEEKPDTDNEPLTQLSEITALNTTPSTTTTTATTIPAKPVNISMDDALFIGDSRTVGIKEYAGINDADFFCTVGLSIYNIHKNPVDVSGVGKVSFTQLISNKKYGKIYITLGINDLGYDTEKTMTKYREFIDLIKNNQPNAYIFIQSNLHVTQKRSDSDEVVNNAAINRFNAALSEFADGKTIFYFDSTGLYDDANGNLSTDKTGDDAHLYAKYYSEWGHWMITQTALLLNK